jgi:hypothetical protein
MTDVQEVWQQKNLPISVFIQQLDNEMKRKERISIWGMKQLPFETNLSKLTRFDVNVVTLYHVSKMNDIFTNICKHHLLSTRYDMQP